MSTPVRKPERVDVCIIGAGDPSRLAHGRTHDRACWPGPGPPWGWRRSSAK